MDNENPIPSEQFRQSQQQAEILRKNVEETGDMDRLSPVERLEMAHDEFTILIAELAPDIKSGRWSSIVVDDVSGRIPALVIYEVMKKWAIDHDQEQPKIFFVASGRGGKIDDTQQPSDSTDNIDAYLDRIKDDLGERTLVITETTVTGRSLQDLGAMLHKNGINYDAAVLFDDSQFPIPNLGEDVKRYGGGAEQWGTVPLYAHRTFHPALRDAIGVEKYGDEATSRATNANQAAVNEMRASIARLANSLYIKELSD